MSIVYVRESLEPPEVERHPEALTLDKAISKLRDEATGLLMTRHRGNSRELAMVLTKLDEARLWSIAYGESVNSHVLVDRREVLQAATTDATDTTVPNGGTNV